MKKVVVSNTMPSTGYVAVGALLTLIVVGVTAAAMNIGGPFSLEGVLALILGSVILISSIVGIFSTHWAILPGQEYNLVEKMEMRIPNELPRGMPSEYKIGADETPFEPPEPVEFDTEGEETSRERKQEDRLEDLRCQVQELKGKLEHKRSGKTKKQQYVEEKLKKLLGEFYDLEQNKR